jgi:hypothetical protein
MVTRSLILACAALVCAVCARADLQFTPKVVDYELDGMKFKQLAFSDGSNKEITYAPPTGWDYSGSATKLTLHPRKKLQAEGTISGVSLSQPATFDEATITKLTVEMLASAPPGSTDVKIVSQEKNPLFIDRKETFIVTISYACYGEKYQRSMMFLNRGNEQVRFQFVSRAADFEDLQRAFLGSQFTWQNL